MVNSSSGVRAARASAATRSVIPPMVRRSRLRPAPSRADGGRDAEWTQPEQRPVAVAGLSTALPFAAMVHVAPTRRRSQPGKMQPPSRNTKCRRSTRVQNLASQRSARTSPGVLLTSQTIGESHSAAGGSASCFGESSPFNVSAMSGWRSALRLHRPKRVWPSHSRSVSPRSRLRARSRQCLVTTSKFFTGNVCAASVTTGSSRAAGAGNAGTHFGELISLPGPGLAGAGGRRLGLLSQAFSHSATAPNFCSPTPLLG